jgi:uncharacterized OB-fold protein
MSTQTVEPFTIEQFYKFIAQGKLMAGKCQKCGKIHLPPRPLCDKCYSQEFTWVTVPNKGKLITYTVIHIAPQQFQDATPYAVGIVQFENGTKLPGMITELPHDQLKVGFSLTVDFTACSNNQSWPQWPRYCFKPL